MKEENSIHEKRDPNFKKLVFDKKVQQHISCGYTKELAEWKVLEDYNGMFNESIGGRRRRKRTNAEGYYC